MKKTIICMAILSLFLPNIIFAAAKKDIGLQLYSLREDFKKDYAASVKVVGEMGFTWVESAGYADGKFYGKSPEEFKKDIEDVGLKVLSSHVMKPLTPEQVKARDFSEAMKFWDVAIAAHKAAGIKYMVIPWLSAPKTLKELKAHCEYFNEVGKKCKAAGIKLGYHNHAHELKKVEDKAVMLNYMLENTDPEYVFFQMDVYWVVMGQESPVAYFKMYPKRFKLLHIKDQKEVGTSGMVGFDAIFKNVDAAGVEGIIVEVEKYSFAPKESVKMSLKYLQDSTFVPESYSK